jgi:hypothetical protein
MAHHFEWVKACGARHLFSSGNSLTLCGIPMLGNNHKYRTDAAPCEVCNAVKKTIGTNVQDKLVRDIEVRCGRVTIFFENCEYGQLEIPNTEMFLDMVMPLEIQS